MTWFSARGQYQLANFVRELILYTRLIIAEEEHVNAAGKGDPPRQPFPRQSEVRLFLARCSHDYQFRRAMPCRGELISSMQTSLTNF